MKQVITFVANDGREFEDRLDCEHHENKLNLTTRLRAHLNWEESYIHLLLHEIENSFDMESSFRDFLKTQDLKRVRGDFRAMPAEERKR